MSAAFDAPTQRFVDRKSGARPTPRKRVHGPPASTKPAVDALIASRHGRRFNADATTLAEDMAHLWPGVTPLDVHRYCGAFLANHDWWRANDGLETLWRQGSPT